MSSLLRSHHHHHVKGANEDTKLTITTLYMARVISSSIETERLTHTVENFTNFSKEDCQSLLSANKPGLWTSPDAKHAVMIAISGCYSALGEILADSFPGFPPYLCDHVERHGVRLPYITGNGKHGDVAFVLSYAGGTGHSRHEFEAKPRAAVQHEDVSSVATRTRQIWIGGWITSMKSPLSRESHPLIILVFHPDKEFNFGRLLWEQYNYAGHSHQKDYGLFTRFQHQPLYVYLDLLGMFISWGHLASYSQAGLEKFGSAGFTSRIRVVNRVKQMRAHVAYLSFLQKQIQIHQAARERLMAVAIELFPSRLNKDSSENVCWEGLSDDEKSRRRFFFRLDDQEYVLSTAASELLLLKEQFQNLIDEEINVASLKTDLRMADLSIMLYVIAPVSLVAAVFGITTFQADVTWFAMLSPVVALLSVALWVWLESLHKTTEQSRFQIPVSPAGMTMFAAALAEDAERIHQVKRR